MNYVYACVLLCGMVNELYSADAQKQSALVALASIVHKATPLPSALNEEIVQYASVAHRLWGKQLSTKGSCFVRRLSDKEFAAVEQNGRITVLDAMSGERKRSLRSHRTLDVLAAEALSPEHVLLALKKGVLRVVNLGKKGAASSFDIPGVPADYSRFKGLALLKAGNMPEVVIGDNRGWSSSIHIFEIDIENKKWRRTSRGVNGFPDCITTLPDRKVRFTQCQDGILRNSICTMDIATGNEEWMEQPDLNALDNPDDGWVPDRITGQNLFVWKFAPAVHTRLMRNGKDLGIVPYGNHELLVADIPGGFVSAFDKQLLAGDDGGNVMQELLAGRAVQEVRYSEGLLTAVSSDGNKRTTVSAWRVAAEEKDDEAKDDQGGN